MPRGGQRGYGNGGRTAYANRTKGGQERAVFIAANVGPAIPANAVTGEGGAPLLNEDGTVLVTE